MAYADADRIVQVLVNLLSNAVKFSPSGSSVIVGASQVDDQVEVRVTDTGRGIPARLLPNIFQRFEQVSASDATEKGGSGLGLAICKDIAELHGGTIGVESEEGKGSTFWFRLPPYGPSEE
jgi:signal transduction histidine kinase